MSDEQKEALPVVGSAMVWKKSKLIERIRVNQNAIQEQEFNAHDKGEAESFDVVLKKDVETLIRSKMDNAFNQNCSDKTIGIFRELLDEVQKQDE